MLCGEMLLYPLLMRKSIKEVRFMALETLSALCTILGISFKDITTYFLKDKSPAIAPEIKPYLSIYGFISSMGYEIEFWKLTHDYCQDLQKNILKAYEIIRASNDERDIPIKRIEQEWFNPTYSNTPNIRNDLNNRIIRYWTSRLEIENPSEANEDYINRRLQANPYTGPNNNVIDTARDFVNIRNSAVVALFQLHTQLQFMDDLLASHEDDVIRRSLWNNYALHNRVDRALHTSDKTLLRYIDLQGRLLLSVNA